MANIEVTPEMLAQFGDLSEPVEPPVYSTAIDPEAASAKSAQLMEDITRPAMADAPSGLVELPGGWISPEGVLHQRAFVKELTGRGEEALARIDIVKNMPLWLNTLVKTCLESVGTVDQPGGDLVQELLIGDREMLILGIRIATYGRILEMDLRCPSCDTAETIGLELDKDIPVKKMETPAVREYDVELRNGHHAVVTPATVFVQDHIWDAKKTAAEMRTAVLAKCVLSIDGVPVTPNVVADLGAADRKTLLTKLSDLQPGPDYEGVRLPCGSCGEEFSVRIDLADLFQ